MATVSTLAAEFAAQPYEVAAFADLGEQDQNAELDADTENMIRSAWDTQKDLIPAYQRTYGDPRVDPNSETVIWCEGCGGARMGDGEPLADSELSSLWLDPREAAKTQCKACGGNVVTGQ